MATGRIPTTANSPLTAKGDLFTFSTGSAKLAVGNNGETLVADSSTSTGLRWQGDYAAGKNKIINGDFSINQRAFTSNTANNTFNFDRYIQFNNGGSFTVTPQTFTAGAAPVAGYEGSTHLRGITATQSGTGDYAIITQRIENVRTLAGQTATISFWAKADTGTPKIAIELSQNFGSGGSPSSAVSTPVGAVTISTSWVRYSATISVPSISGKTVGTTANTSYLEVNLWTSAGSTLNTRASSIGIQNFTADIWGLQVEQGSTATAFQTATGTIQGELAACRRYLPALSGAAGGGVGTLNGYAYGTNQSVFLPYFDTPARVAPTGMTVSGTFSAFAINTSTGVTPTFSAASQFNAQILASHTITAGQGSRLQLEANSLILFTGSEL